jgi:hypothetical protein
MVDPFRIEHRHQYQIMISCAMSLRAYLTLELLADIDYLRLYSYTLSHLSADGCCMRPRLAYIMNRGSNYVGSQQRQTERSREC